MYTSNANGPVTMDPTQPPPGHEPTNARLFYTAAIVILAVGTIIGVLYLYSQPEFVNRELAVAGLIGFSVSVLTFFYSQMNASINIDKNVQNLGHAVNGQMQAIRNDLASSKAETIAVQTKLDAALAAASVLESKAKP
jgi:hypothetical protein